MSWTGTDEVRVLETIAIIAEAEAERVSKFMMSPCVLPAKFPGLTGETKGPTVETPRWTEIGGGQFGLAENAEITPGNLDYKTGFFPIVRWYNRTDWLDIAQLMTDGNIQNEIGRQQGVKSGEAFDKACIAILEGAAAANTGNVVSATGAAAKAADVTALEAVFGDRQESMRNAVIVTRSTVYNKWRNIAASAFGASGYSATDKANEVISTGSFETFFGHPIIVSDELSLVSAAYPIYLVGEGAIRYQDQVPFTLDYDRDKKKKKNMILAEWARVMGPQGMSYTGTVSTPMGPSLTDLGTSTNYELAAVKAALVKIARITVTA